MMGDFAQETVCEGLPPMAVPMTVKMPVAFGSENVPIEIASNPHNELYLRTKRDKMDHAIMRDH